MYRFPYKDWEEIPMSLLLFGKDQAESRLDDVLDEAAAITDRGYKLIGIILPIATIVVAYLLSGTVNQKQSTILTVSAAIGLIPLLLCGLRIYKIVAPREVHRGGIPPSELFQDFTFMENDYSDDEKEKYILLFIIEQTQQKIDETMDCNNKRISRYRNTLAILFWSAIIYMLASLGLIIF